MKLGVKILFLLAVLWGSTILLANWVSWRLFSSSLTRLEEADGQARLLRVVNLLRLEQTRLDNLCHDWAGRPELLPLLAGPGNGAAARLFPDSRLAEAGVHAVLLVTEDGNTAAFRSVPVAGESDGAMPAFNRPGFPPGHPLMRPAGVAPSPQLAWSSTCLFLVSVQPVRAGAGPGAGRLAVGRRLSPAEIVTLNEAAQIPFRLLPVPADTPPPGKPVAAPDQARPDIMLGRLALPDWEGSPSVLLESAMPRTAYHRARELWRGFVTGMTGFSTAAVLFVLLILQAGLLKRVAVLTETAKAVSAAGEGSRRVPPLGGDEIGRLGAEFNRMLDLLAERNRALALGEARYRSFLEHFPGMVYQTTLGEPAQSHFHGAVQAMTGHTAADLAAGRPAWRDLVPPEERQAFDTAETHVRAGAGVVKREYHIRRADGRPAHIQEFIQRVIPPPPAEPFLEGTLYDVTEAKEQETRRRDVEKQLQKTQHLEAVGLLASGVAHDFNNLLQGILGHASLAEQLCAAGTAVPAGPLRQKLDIIQSAARRGAALVHDLLTFSRQSRAETEAVPVNNVIRELQRFAERTFPRSLVFALDLEEPLPDIQANRALLLQALLNLGLNARDAMPRGGTLTLRTRFGFLRKKPAVVLFVTDTGEGMTAAVRDRLFTPFFTTKPPGKGTGLGLSMVYGMVTALGGAIACESEPGQGATFILHLPVNRLEQTSSS